ncbi:adenosylmethionine--8-amino-7-oxononanoate transaminase [Haliovirga abyssi]|uniref:Adenosylmethionine-8-amino-7-oxononanoate aminotransferase n=1 Tax=Haliovirga abyssi TaxID=2996794 RepID=A0AAU9D9N3_9FUSO|nr:adenosylmethionine--8-amino-7-oxononanoate transaminase [Haliovirga abyssi]BDU50301.1 adenosylmethionine-8-amino-7-oxononanoate aminotransferase [Haliovirga abyssi]
MIGERIWLEKDREYVWHPFTQMKDYENKDHVLIERGEGIFLYDYNGKEYYDTISSWWVNVHGHNNVRIKKAIIKQMEKIEHVNFSGFTHTPAIELAERIINLMPKDLTRVFYSDNGSTAVEVALKMSFQYWKNKGFDKKKNFIYFENSYHGDTIGAVSVGGVQGYHGLYKPLLFDSFISEAPNCKKCKYNKEANSCQLECLNGIEKILEENSETISGVIIEPLIQAAGGMHFYSPRVLKKLREVTKQYNVHLIIDEVAMGFGRTGKMWAFEHAGITPDLVSISKGISAGYLPLAATIVTDDIYNAFYDDYNKNKTFFHGHSYTANPLACAAGIESLKIFEEDKLLEKVKETSEYLEESMKVFENNEHIENIRCLGLIAAMDVVKNKKTSEKYDSKIRIGKKIYEKGFEHGLVLRPVGDTIYYFLPLSVKKEDIKEIIKRTQDVLLGVL